MQIPIEGRHHQAGEGRTGATVGAMVAAGLVGGMLVKGKSAKVEEGREFTVRTVDAIPVTMADGGAAVIAASYAPARVTMMTETDKQRKAREKAERARGKKAGEPTKPTRRLTSNGKGRLRPPLFSCPRRGGAAQAVVDRGADARRRGSARRRCAGGRWPSAAVERVEQAGGGFDEVAGGAERCRRPATAPKPISHSSGSRRRPRRGGAAWPAHNGCASWPGASIRAAAARQRRGRGRSGSGPGEAGASAPPVDARRSSIRARARSGRRRRSAGCGRRGWRGHARRGSG